ncbi:hypothetical protein [Rickettsia endosymbiont of Lasioglossum villosulum]|uniref:hypothetical protein n=1 Tax=Rickettsia endosymbiont of Lasioglossum villosulum TaxID=3066269 RepID=UPI003133167D
MFNFLQSNYELFLISIYTFLIILTIRHFIKNKYLIVLCHLVTFLTFFVMSIGGGSVENDAYKRYEEFVLLEQNKQLENAKKNPDQFDPMFQIDLRQFKDPDEFKKYLLEIDDSVDKSEAMMLGWIFAFLYEISKICAFLLVLVFRKNCMNKFLSRYVRRNG